MTGVVLDEKALDMLDNSSYVVAITTNRAEND